MNTIFESFPVLETERFYLRKIELSDADDLFHYFSKDEVTKYYNLDTFTSIEQAEDLIQRFEQRFQEQKAIRWGIALKETNQLIGSCGYHKLEPEHFKAEIGYEITPEHWRKGVMTEVLQTILPFGFEKMGLNRIEAIYNPENEASRKVLAKLGFKDEGILYQRYFEKGKFVDSAVAALLKK
ncbi:GNAT family N-acetyltransferase [Neobacillus sp. D3-1R]|uniref:GNAT family N-acetyltransferase n=1 Tax=Neobacillus sp. D3-1R TaxID=3445778 RepID=UPI003F9FE55B